MKPPPFRYHAPTTVAEATRVLGEVGTAKVLAGGQSLIPLLNMRLVAPSDLVDINGVTELDRIHVGDDGVRVGAAVRQAELQRHAAAMTANPLLARALPLVAHPVIRNRGTVVGSIAHADPAAELPAVLALTDGTVELASADGTVRTVAASAFFLAPLEADLGPGELATAVRFGPLPPGTGASFVEVSRRHGDYALCGIAATIERNGGGLTRARVATISVHPTPLVIDVTDFLDGDLDRAARDRAGTGDGLAAAGEHVAASVEPEADLHATVDYRRHLTRVVTARALGEAWDRAQGWQGSVVA